MTGLAEVLRWTALVMLSCVVPLGIFVGRNNIRAFRREIVRDLERLFSFASLPNGAPLIIPSFELVKYKYDPEANPERDLHDDPHRFAYYLLPVAIYIILTALGFRMAFMPDAVPLANYFVFPISVPDDLAAAERPFLGALSYTFIGSYIWTIQYLVRRISNFDLAPISFFQSIGHILLAVFTIAAIWHSQIFASLGPHAMVVIAFLVGFFPTLCMDALMAKFPWLRLRRVSSGKPKPAGGVSARHDPRHRPVHEAAPCRVRDRGRAEPGDDQPDLDLRGDPLRALRGHRLGRAGAADPGGRVGSHPAAARTQHPHDFRPRRALDSPALRRRLLPALVGEPPAAGETIQSPAGASEGKQHQPVALGNSEIQLDRALELDSLVAIIRDDLHVQRLRQIWDVISDRLQQRPIPPADVPVRNVQLPAAAE